MKAYSLILAALMATAGIVNAAEPAKAPAKAEKKVEKKEEKKKEPPSAKKPTPKKKAEPK
jgi:hypothetical protein